MPKPVVALVGRPNVGKSTLFNRITGGLVAIVEDKPGVTRDRLYRDVEWMNTPFILIDTGGIEFGEKNDILLQQTRVQAEIGIEEADVIIFIIDAREGVTSTDLEVAKILRRSNKPVILAANKVENFNNPPIVYESYSLGLGEALPISASHGMNVGDLLDKVVDNLPSWNGQDYDPDVIKIAVIGRPNVGKSSLVNTLIGENRVIVSNIPGTTRDAIDTPFTREGKEYVLIDTAGMRRKSRIDDPTERYSVVRSLRAVDRSDVVLMVFDAVAGITEQDKKIVGYAHEAGKAIILIVNKWDLIEKDEKTMNKYTEKLREELGFMQYAPSLFVSALTKQRVPKILELVDFVAEQHSTRISTGVLNEFIREITLINPPPTDKGRRLKILFVTQVGVKPPTFVIFLNDPELMHFSYKRFIENKVRENFGFEGTPLRFVIRKRQEEE